MIRAITSLVTLVTFAISLLQFPFPGNHNGVGGGGGSVTYDNSGFAICSNSGVPIGCQVGGNFQIEVTLTVGSGSNRACFAVVGMSGSGTDVEPTPVSVTFDGNAMTAIPGTDSTGNYYLLMYYIINPASGSKTAHFGVTGLGVGNSKMGLGVVCASGVNQTTPYDVGFKTANTTGTSTGAQTVTNGSNDLGVAGLCQGTSITSGTGTQRWVDNNSTGACSSYAGYTVAGGTTSVTYGFGASDSWRMVFAAFKP